MPIETICQGCARKLRVPDEHAGKKARCPQCGMIYVVPGEPFNTGPFNTGPINTGPNTTEADSSGTDSSGTDSSGADTRSSRLGNSAPRDASERWQMRTPDGRVWGPVSKQELDQWYAEGRVPGNATLLREGDPQWRPATEIYPQPPSGRQRLSEQRNPFAESAGTTPFHGVSYPLQHHYQEPHRGGVILALAVIGWVFCPVFAPFAWAMGQSDLRSIRSGQMDPSGQSLTQSGMVLGAVETILLIVIMFFMCLGSTGFGSTG